MRPQNALTTAGASALILAATALAEVNFERTSIKAPFVEQFQEQIPQSRWTVSRATKQTPVGDETFSYVGTWAVEEPEVFPGIKGDTGLVLKSKAAHHAISTLFPEPIDPKGKPLVVQYEVKLQKGLECGGAYIKLLTADSHGGLKKGEDYTDKTPFTIMFGPDRCGQTNKVHFIFRHKNPLTGEYEEKHLSKAPLPKITKTTALYTLIVEPNNDFRILVNDEQAVSGSLLEDFRPPVNPDRTIDDPNDTKPDDWVDNALIDDEDAVKPDDWDEDAPLMIEDEAATQPEDWLVDEPLQIPDPEAEKPEEWDDEEDGDWIAPTVDNPKCQEVSGCGPWTRPKIKNPNYKGIWTRPQKPNPAYKGVWGPRRIDNPDFYEDLEPANFEPIGGVGIELWTMTEDILFDNIYIGHSEEDAKKFAKETYHVKKPIEQEQEGSTEDEDEDAEKLSIVDKARMRLYSFRNLFILDPAGAFKEMPEVPAALLATLLGFLGLLATLGGLFSAGKSTKKQPVVVKKATVKPAPAPVHADAPLPVVPATEAKIEEIPVDDPSVRKRATRSTAQ